MTMQTISGMFGGPGSGIRRRVMRIGILLVLANLAAWAWAIAAFQGNTVLLGTAVLAYTLGLRHAVDADHIAAIDNVTRAMVQDGKRPVAVGLFFSLGHSAVVLLACIAIALTAAAIQAQFEGFRVIGGLIGTSVSALFLLAIAAANLVVLLDVYRTFRQVKAGAPYRPEALDGMLAGSGPLSRLLRPLIRMIRHSWHMAPLGFLFGLGFDTATEVGLLGISATQASHGIPVWSILVFPALFAAGMSLVDTADSVLMLGAYGWALTKPVRKLYYNMTITAVSVLVAVLVGGIETLGLVQDRLELTGPFWNGVESLNGNFGTVGALIVGLFVLCLLTSTVIYRLRGYDRL